MRRLKLFLALALAASICVPAAHVTNVTATTTEENVVEYVPGQSSLEEEIENAAEGTTIQLTEDYIVEYSVLSLKPTNPNVTLDLNGHKIKADSKFNFEGILSNSEKNLVSIDMGANGFTIKNGILTANGNNGVRNILNVFETSNVTIENIALDHSTAGSGAPLIVNSSTVTLKGDVDLITGANSWYAANVDNPHGNGAANLNAEEANVSFSGNSLKSFILIQPGSDDTSVSGFEDLGNGFYGKVAATIGENKYSSVQLAVDAAKDGETVVVSSGRHEEEVTISNKAIKLVGEDGAELFAVTAINGTGNELEGLTIENIHFYGASNQVHGDVNATALYIQGPYKDVVVKDNEFVYEGTLWANPYLTPDCTIAITTGWEINGMLVENNLIKGYTISAYHNPDWTDLTQTGSNDIVYTGNTFEDILSGAYFGGVDHVTVTDNTFIKSNGLRFAYGSSIDDLSENAFVSRPDDTSYGSYAVRFYDNGVNGEADLSDNYWGTTDLSTVITNDDEDFEYTLDTYYVSSDMTDKNTDTDIFELDSLEVELQEGATLTVNVTAKDHEGNPVPVTWTSQDESVATVKDGVITAVKEGQIVIVVEANGVTKEIKVTVTKAGSDVPTNPETPTDPETPSDDPNTGFEDKPTETPNTSDMSLIGCYGMMALLSLAILVVLNKKRALSK